MRESGLMTKLMVMVFTLIQTEQNMKVIGKMTYSMVMEKKLGLTVLSMRENILKVKNMAVDYIFGPMVQCIRETG